MASLQTLVDVEEIRGMIQRGLSHLQISGHLNIQIREVSVKGVSEGIVKETG